jgi:hypothetical protein
MRIRASRTSMLHEGPSWRRRIQTTKVRLAIVCILAMRPPVP